MVFENQTDRPEKTGNVGNTPAKGKRVKADPAPPSKHGLEAESTSDKGKNGPAWLDLREIQGIRGGKALGPL